MTPQKTLFFDAGPIISFATNNLLGIVKELKQLFGGKFCITPAVYAEIVTKPFSSKRFKFESLQVQALLRDGTLEMVNDSTLEKEANDLLNLANNCFVAKGTPLQIVHLGEMHTLAAALRMPEPIVVIDERTTRTLLEDPRSLVHLLEHKLETPITIQTTRLNEFIRRTKKIRFIRSTELAIVAYEHGLLDAYLPLGKDAHAALLDAILWGLKLNGCAISEREIEQIIKIETTKYLNK